MQMLRIHIKKLQGSIQGLLRYASTRAAIVVFLACIGLWVIHLRLAVIDELRATVESADALASEVGILRLQLPPSQAAAMDELEAHSGNKFLRDVDHLAGWLTTLNRRAAGLVLTTTHVVGEANSSPQGFDGMELLPVQFSIQSSEDEGSLDVFIKYLRILTEEEIIADIDQFTLTGKGQGPEKMDLNLNVWIRVAT
jgi:hypothetical protein